MKCKLRMASFSLGLCTVCLFLAQGLWAQSANSTKPGVNTGCGYDMGQPNTPIRPQRRSNQAEGEFRSPQLLMVADHQSGHQADSATIVGLWKVSSRYLITLCSMMDTSLGIAMERN